MISSTLKSLASQFDAFLIDQYGVLLDGNGAMPNAPAALTWLSGQGKPIVLLSNSGKRSMENENRLSDHAFRREDYVLVMSSGEAAHSVLSRRIGSSINPGARVWAHSRDGDLSHIAGLDLTPTERPDKADLLLISGVQSDCLTLPEYEEILQPAADRNVPCLCSNPDLEMMSPDGIRFAAGRVGKLYERLGGKVEFIGKPYPLLYAEAALSLSEILPEKILCIGDSPAHDVIGGRGAGHKTALVRTGLHAKLSDKAVMELCRHQDAMPDFLIPAFSVSERGE